MKKIILALLVIVNVQSTYCAQAQQINNALPSVDITEVPEDFTCNICMDGIETDAELCQTICQCNNNENPVRHIFHKKCILNAFIAMPGKRCPICKDIQTTVLYDKNDLLQAYENGDLELAETIIRYGMIPEAEWIVLACAKNNIEFARMVLANSTEPDLDKNINTYLYPIQNYYTGLPTQTTIQVNAFMHACHNNNLELVQLLMANGVNINCHLIVETLDGSLKFIVNPLFITCANNNLELAQFLIENGATKFLNSDFTGRPDDTNLQGSSIAVALSRASRIQNHTNFMHHAKESLKILNLLCIKPIFYIHSLSLFSTILKFKFRPDEDLTLDWIVNPVIYLGYSTALNAIRRLRERFSEEPMLFPF